MAEGWMTTEEAAARLGVKAETLYAYVSRGVIRSERIPGERRSRFLRADVERLAGRQRGGGRAGGLEIVVESELTLLDPTGRLFYRGWDVEDAARSASFEDVATWLWTGTHGDVPFEASKAALRAARRVVSALPREAPTIDRLRAVVVAIRGLDPLRDDRRPVAVALTGRSLIATLVDALPTLAGGEPPASGSVASRLWPRLSSRRATAERVRLLDAAMIMLADHELAASTFAARVAASTWADPYLVVEAGFAALGGPLHGGASDQARRMLRDASRSGDAAAVVGARLRDGELIPGFGHRVYLDRDPRADLLLRLLEDAGALDRVAAARGVLETMRRRKLPFANIDFALAVLAEDNDMIAGATEITFAIARVVGWLAHAVEEYDHRLRFRPRAAYVGPRPAGG
ncbi:MAG TPA: citrate/2-methylcitrate synthase [Acidimicrobiales bacterium]|nr:citrate/2-methylcitrate synthase [Acidimicrobiales bacterium]